MARDDPESQRVWDMLVAHIGEHTGVARTDIEKVLDAECAFWNKRIPLRKAVLDSYDTLDEDDEA